MKTHKRFCDKTVAAGILECSVAEDSEIIYLILNITNKGFSPSDNDAATVYLIAPGDKVQVTRIFKDLQELNVTHAVSLISNGYSISLPGMKPRESNELMVVLNKARDVANKSYIINLKYNEYPHLTQRAQKNIDIDTATVSLDSVFSVETYAGRKGLRYYIWMALATVAFIAILALGVFYVARIWKRRENVPVDLPLPEIIREEVPSIEVAESKDNL